MNQQIDNSKIVSSQTFSKLHFRLIFHMVNVNELFQSYIFA
jgi:hypothetical protein